MGLAQADGWTPAQGRGDTFLVLHRLVGPFR